MRGDVADRRGPGARARGHRGRLLPDPLDGARAGVGAQSFAERDRIAAENFAAAASSAGVRRIVYLGGLVRRTALRRPAIGPACDARARISRHLASREQVERILLEAVADSLALRASIVIGARSRSFRLLVHLVERMPVLALPAWQRCAPSRSTSAT